METTHRFMAFVWMADGTKEALNKFVTPAKAGVQLIENTGFRLSPE